MSEALEQVKKNQAADEEEITVSKEKAAAPEEKADAFMKALSEFAVQWWNEAILKATGPGGQLYEKEKRLLKEYYRLFGEIKDKIGFQLTDRLTTLRGELDSLGLDYVYYQGLKDGARLYRILTEE